MKPYVVLTTVRGASGSWSFEIRLSLQTGKMYCTCPAFFVDGVSCPHMDAYKAHPTFRSGKPSAAPHVEPQRTKRKPSTPAAQLVAELARLNIVVTPHQASTVLRRMNEADKPKRARKQADDDRIGEHGGPRLIIIPD